MKTQKNINKEKFYNLLLKIVEVKNGLYKELEFK